MRVASRDVYRCVFMSAWAVIQLVDCVVRPRGGAADSGALQEQCCAKALLLQLR